MADRVGARLQFNLQILFDLANQIDVLLQQLPIFAADHRFDFLEIIGQIIQHAGQQLPVLRLPVQLVEHFVRVIDRCDGLIGTGVRHSSPGVGTVGHHHTKFQRTETGSRRRVGLQLILQELIDADTHRPTRRRVTAALNVAGEQFHPRQQTTDATHVTIAVTLNLVAQSLQRQRLAGERFQRF